MAKMGRPRKTDDIRVLVQRMLKKRDVVSHGKKVRRLEALIEILWKRVFASQGKDRDAVRFLLSYGFGTPVAGDKLPDLDKAKSERAVVEIPDHVADLIAEMDAELKVAATVKKAKADVERGQDAGNA